jgi:hypothetical protein
MTSGRIYTCDQNQTTSRKCRTQIASGLDGTHASGVPPLERKRPRLQWTSDRDRSGSSQFQKKGRMPLHPAFLYLIFRVF